MTNGLGASRVLAAAILAWRPPRPSGGASARHLPARVTDGLCFPRAAFGRDPHGGLPGRVPAAGGAEQGAVLGQPLLLRRQPAAALLGR